MVNTEDINAKMRATGWTVLEVSDGCYDVDGIERALEQAKSSTDKPTFINVKTVIGLGSALAGKAASHGAPLGAENVKEMKRASGFNVDEYFVVGDEVRNFFSDLPARGEGFVKEWEELMGRYVEAYPELGAELQSRIRGEIRKDWKALIPKEFDTAPHATRVSQVKMLSPVLKEVNSFMAGTADLTPSVNMLWPGVVDFQPVSQQPLQRKSFLLSKIKN